jgi:hypothetical protein
MPNLTKKIICLAKSRKTGGLCVAGKEIQDDGTVGQWVRPVSARETEEISANECRFENGHQPNLLDIIEVPLQQHHPNYFQCENYLIDDNHNWSKEGVYNSEYLIRLIDNPDSLWEPDSSSTYGVKDRVDECNLNELEDSLYLITPTSLNIIVQTEGEGFGNPKRKVRALFGYNGKIYLFPVTDPSIESCYRAKEIGTYPLENPENRIFMCVSIGLPFKNYCYKFVASLIQL